MNHKFSKAYYELGLLYQKGPFLKDEAIENLRWAIYYDKNLKDAYYQRALLIIEYQDYRRGHKQMEKSVLLDPVYKNCYDLYLKIGFTFHQFGEMAELLRHLISKYPSEKNFQLDLIAVEYRNGHYDTALNLRNQFRQAHPKFQPAALWLNASRILFALGQDTLATELYWKGVDAIQTTKDAHDYFKDMVMLVDDDECDEYYRTKLPEMKDYFYRFWKSRDLTLTTTFNDRLSEHYQ